MNDFSDISFEENSSARAPFVFVLDCSNSMTQKFDDEPQTPLESLNAGLDVLVSEIYKDKLARARADLCFVPYGSEVMAVTPFSTVDSIALPELSPGGMTSTGAALNAALDALETREKEYNDNGIQKYVSQMFLISDGLSTDDLSHASQRIKDLESKKRLAFFPIGVVGADLEELSSIGTRPALPLKGLDFASLFEWVSRSAVSVSASQPGDRVALPSPAGWAEI